MNVGKRSAQRGNHLFKTFAPLLLAKEFGATAGLREAMQNAGVVDKPDIYFLSLGIVGSKCCMKSITDTGAPFAAPRTVVNVAGSRYVVLATAPETDSAYSAFEIFVPPSAGTPLHAHVDRLATMLNDSFSSLDGGREFIDTADFDLASSVGAHEPRLVSSSFGSEVPERPLWLSHFVHR
jgi:hypothetical protein